MIDNTHVVVLAGTGAQMVPVPEMAAFAERFGFAFKAHERGDANRSGRVERPFHFIENNFLAGRSFTDFEHINREAVAWCDRVNLTFNKRFNKSRRELFSEERAQLTGLPIWVPEVYMLHHRIVDIEGYVTVQKNRYSVPYKLIGRRVEVRETKDTILIFDGPREIAQHHRVYEPQETRITLPEHRPPRGESYRARHVAPEESTILALMPELSVYVAALKQRGAYVRPLRQLLRLTREYPREPLLAAVGEALKYGLFDLFRVETMILKHTARDYFKLNFDDDDDKDDDDGHNF